MLAEVDVPSFKSKVINGQRCKSYLKRDPLTGGKWERLKYSQVGDFKNFVKYGTVYKLNYSKLSHHFQAKYIAFTGHDSFIEQSNLTKRLNID